MFRQLAIARRLAADSAAASFAAREKQKSAKPPKSSPASPIKSADIPKASLADDAAAFGPVNTDQSLLALSKDCHAAQPAKADSKAQFLNMALTHLPADDRP